MTSPQSTVAATEILMPQLSDSMEEGTVLTWIRNVGEDVTAGSDLVEIETDKANMAYEAEVDGTLLQILVAEGETVSVGTPIGLIGDPAAHPISTEKPVPQAEAEAVDAIEAPPGPVAEPASESAEVSPPRREGRRPKASPLARRIAVESAVDLSAVPGTGPGGRIVADDVRQAAERSTPPLPNEASAGATAKGEGETVELSKLQQVVARRMSESKATAPHFYLEATIDMTAAVRGRLELKAASAEGERIPSLNDMVVKASALALREFPRANGSYKNAQFELHSRINVGIAVAAQDALVVPTVFDADRKGIAEIAAEARLLAERVRDGSITPPELAGGTFTVSNLGMFGVRSFGAVVNPPQAAILAVGQLEERAVVKAAEIVVTDQMDVTLSCDHRILYGAEAAEFLALIKGLLEAPLKLAL